ncbi:hypothetical protein PV325_008131 [Microctonus aethiopoides]|nr:hypothetical protein PV325_008131 [Microctonus aethiopoides]
MFIPLNSAQEQEQQQQQQQQLQQQRQYYTSYGWKPPMVNKEKMRTYRKDYVYRDGWKCFLCAEVHCEDHRLIDLSEINGRREIQEERVAKKRAGEEQARDRVVLAHPSEQAWKVNYL